MPSVTRRRISNTIANHVLHQYTLKPSQLAGVTLLKDALHVPEEGEESDPEAWLALEQRFEALNTALRQHSPRAYATLILHRCEGIPLKEIAPRLGCSYTMVKRYLGELYVAKHFPPDSKDAMDALVSNLREAYVKRIAEEPRMTPETRAVALEKLKAFRSKIGYPVKWRDYSKLTASGEDALGTTRARRPSTGIDGSRGSISPLIGTSGE
jgi:hypothetical protein